MNRLVISPRHLNTLGRHASMTYPNECCGVLIGSSTEDTTVVERVLSVGNESVGNDSMGQGRDRYLIHPETVLAAHKEARSLGLDVVGYYHSHPDHPAQPSEVDREQAWPGMSYLIVSLKGRTVVDTRSWRLADNCQFDEEAIVQGAIGAAAPRPPAVVPRQAVG